MTTPGTSARGASAPLLGEASGDFIYFPLTYTGAEYAVETLERIAGEQGLVFFDPHAVSTPAEPSGHDGHPEPQPSFTEHAGHRERPKWSWWPFRR